MGVGGARTVCDGRVLPDELVFQGIYERKEAEEARKLYRNW